jgi:hypothetical protein
LLRRLTLSQRKSKFQNYLNIQFVPHIKTPIG